MIRRRTNAEKIAGYLESIYPGWASAPQISKASGVGSVGTVTQLLIRMPDVESRNDVHPMLYRIRQEENHDNV